MGALALTCSGTLTLIHQMRRDQTPKARETVPRLLADTMDPYVIRAGLSFSALSCGQCSGLHPKRIAARSADGLTSILVSNERHIGFI